MRIIGGTHRGRRIDPPSKKFPTRPTTDFVRESLFNILNNSIAFEDIKLLDLFGGFGMIGFESISRGCEDVTYIDKHRGCHAFVKNTAKKLGVEEKIKCINMDALKFVKQTDQKFDLIYADPPYAANFMKDIPSLIFEHKLLNEDGLLIIEHDSNISFEGDDKCYNSRKYGQSILSFFT